MIPDPIPVIFNIHVEPNMRCIPFSVEPWTGYENLHAFLFDKRHLIKSVTNRTAQFNWLLRLDPQIAKAYGSGSWVLDTYGTLLEQALEAGDELGVHVHAWRPDQMHEPSSWVADFSDSAWIAECINTAHNAFIKHFKRVPVYFSFGDHFMSQEVLTQLESLGYKADISMYPGRPLMQRFVEKERAKGWLPGFLHTPRHPFKPSLSDWRRPNTDQASNSMTIWEIPVSVADLPHLQNPEVLMSEKLLIGIPSERAIHVIEENLSSSNPFLLAEMRTDVRLDAYNRSQFDKTIDYLINHPRIQEMQWMTVSQFLSTLES